MISDGYDRTPSLLAGSELPMVGSSQTGWENLMSERQNGTRKLHQTVNGQACILWDRLDRFADEYGAMILRGRVLPPNAAGELAKIITSSRELMESTSAIALADSKAEFPLNSTASP